MSLLDMCLHFLLFSLYSLSISNVIQLIKFYLHIKNFRENNQPLGCFFFIFINIQKCIAYTRQAASLSLLKWFRRDITQSHLENPTENDSHNNLKSDADAQLKDTLSLILLWIGNKFYLLLHVVIMVIKFWFFFISSWF